MEDALARSIAAGIVAWRSGPEGADTSADSSHHAFHAVTEILRTGGVSVELLRHIAPLLTVSSDGRINVNTARRLSSRAFPD